MKKKIIIITAAIVAAAGAVGFGIYNFSRSSGDGIPANAAPVQLETIAAQTVKQQVTAKGYVEMIAEHAVYPRGQGRIGEVLVKKGDMVAEGQVIARYDAEALDDLRDRLTEAELSLRSAELSLAEAKLPAVSKMEISQAESGVAQAESGVVQAEDGIKELEAQIAQYELTLQQMDGGISLAEKKYDSTKLLFDYGAVSQEELDAAFDSLKRLRDERAGVEQQRATAIDSKQRAEGSVVRAEDAVERAEQQYELTLAQQTDPQVQNRIAQQELQVEKARLLISQIQHQIDTFVSEEVSTHAGMVMEMGIQASETLTSSVPILTVADVTPDNLVIKVNVPEAEAVGLAEGQDAEITASAFEGVYPAKVGKISPIAEDQMVGNAQMRVLTVDILPDAGASSQLKSGYSVEAVITTRTAENAVVVPLMSTMSSEDGEDYVFVMRDDFSLERRVITLGAYSGMYIEALSGVAVGEKVVVNPTPSLAEGAFVRPIGAGAAQ